MTTNLLAMPLVAMTISTGNNEDFVTSIVYVVNTVAEPQLDLRGIIFEMEIRRAPAEHEVVLSASTENGLLLIGDPPNFGHLIFQIPIEKTRGLTADTYVGDIIGRDDFNTRVVATIDLTIIEGITTQPVATTVIQ